MGDEGHPRCSFELHPLALQRLQTTGPSRWHPLHPARNGWNTLKGEGFEADWWHRGLWYAYVWHARNPWNIRGRLAHHCQHGQHSLCECNTAECVFKCVCTPGSTVDVFFGSRLKTQNAPKSMMHIIIEDQEATPNLKNNTKARNKFATSASQGVERERVCIVLCTSHGRESQNSSPNLVHRPSREKARPLQPWFAAEMCPQAWCRWVPVTKLWVCICGWSSWACWFPCLECLVNTHSTNPVQYVKKIHQLI